jgi:hypothetical protein
VSFDWSPFFGSYSTGSYIVVAFTGAFALAPVVVVLLAAKWGLGFVRALGRLLRL